MRINLLLILPLVLLATVGSAQEVVGTLVEDIRVNSVIDANGQLSYSEGSSVFLSHPEWGSIDEVFFIIEHPNRARPKNPRIRRFMRSP